MSFWRKLLGGSSDDHIGDSEGDIRPVSDYVPPQAANFFNEAWKYYPHEDPARALSLLLEGLKYIDKAPDDKCRQEDIDLSDIGNAFWAAWVCLDLLDRPAEETRQLLEQAREKSPATLKRIEQRLTEHLAESELNKRIESAASVLTDVANTSEQAVSQAIKELSELCERQGTWWELRDVGISLGKQGQHDRAWSLLNQALSIAISKNGNLPSLYVAMGDLRKAESKHHDAARLYMLSCATPGGVPLKRAADQLRISLKKAGVSGDATAIRDELLSLIGKMEPNQIIARLDSYVKRSPPAG